MKDKMITIKVAESFRERVKAAADYYGINQSQFIIQAINEKIGKDKNITEVFEWEQVDQ